MKEELEKEKRWFILRQIAKDLENIRESFQETINYYDYEHRKIHFNGCKKHLKLSTDYIEHGYGEKEFYNTVNENYEGFIQIFQECMESLIQEKKGVENETKWFEREIDQYKQNIRNLRREFSLRQRAT